MKIPECRSKTSLISNNISAFLAIVSYFVLYFFFIFFYNVTCYGCPGRATYRTHTYIFIFIKTLQLYKPLLLCASSFVFYPCPAWQSIYGGRGRREWERERVTATSSEVFFMYFTYRTFVYFTISVCFPERFRSPLFVSHIFICHCCWRCH